MALDRHKLKKAEKKIEPISGKEENKNDTRRQVILLATKIIFFVLVIYIVLFVIFGVTRMKDFSMYPSVKDGDLLIYYRMENNFNNGDIIVVNNDSQDGVYRIIASPGQTVDINDEEGTLKIDGQPSTYEAFYETKRADQMLFKYPYKVSTDCYFVLNDYRSNTDDSRSFGEVCKDNIKGRLITKIQVRDF